MRLLQRCLEYNINQLKTGFLHANHVSPQLKKIIHFIGMVEHGKNKN